MHNRKIRRKSPNMGFSWFKNVNIFKILSILLIIFFILCIPAVVKRLIKIEKIDCQSQFGSCDLNIQPGSYDFVKRQIEGSLNGDIKVLSYLIQYKIPSRVRVDIVFNEFKHVIKNSSGSYYQIDKNGVVLEITQEQDDFQLSYDVSYNIGDRIDEKILFALKLIDKVKIINTISSSMIVDHVLTINFNNGVIAKLPLEGDIDVLAGSLRLIFSRLNEGKQGIKMEDVHEIDLRFKNPVLR